MARSVEELRLESERNRATLAATVDQLRSQLSDTAEDLRQKVSPQHIKSEVSDYISDKTHGLLGSLKQQAMDNPLQAIAAGTTVAVPLLRIARGFPLPLLMITAGLALTSKTVRGRATQAPRPATAGGMVDQAAERVQAFGDDVMDKISSARAQAADVANDAQSRISGLAEDVTTRMGDATGRLTDNIKGGFDAAKDRIQRAQSTASDTIDATRQTAAAAPEKARQAIGDNAVLIGGIGIAIGAIIAAALPKTQAEAKVMGNASDSVNQTANEAAQSGFAAVKDKAMSAADAAARSVAESDLGEHASRMTQNLADSLKEAAEDAVAAAFDPSHTHSENLRETP